jgi:hypothetical protein
LCSFILGSGCVDLELQLNRNKAANPDAEKLLPKALPKTFVPTKIDMSLIAQAEGECSLSDKRQR